MKVQVTSGSFAASCAPLSRVCRILIIAVSPRPLPDRSRAAHLYQSNRLARLSWWPAGAYDLPGAQIKRVAQGGDVPVCGRPLNGAPQRRR